MDLMALVAHLCMSRLSCGISVLGFYNSKITKCFSSMTELLLLLAMN